MKCPYRKISYADGSKLVEDFGECYEKECPFYGRTVLKKRYEGGYTQLLEPACRRADKESEDTE